MATQHASYGQIVNLDTWAQELSKEKTKAIVKTDEHELVRIVLPKNKEIPSHKVDGPIIFHCLKGKIEFSAMGSTQLLSQGELLHLAPGEPHSLVAQEDSAALLIIIFKS